MFDFVKNKKIFFAISGALILISIVSFFVRGLNLDTDFKGGTAITVSHLENGVNEDELTQIVLENSGKHVSSFQRTGDNGAVIKTDTMETEEQTKVRQAIMDKYGLEDINEVMVETVSASIGQEMQTSALTAALIAVVLMLVYISFRFELLSGLSAIVSLVHNIVILIGLYSVFQWPVNTTFIAAVLTILGYSINDTIVIFDRIRETNKTARKTPFSSVVNESTRKSVTRSCYTSLTTLLTIFVLYLAGAFEGLTSITQFALPIILGVIIGTYSSLFIASPFWATIRGDGKYASKQ